METIIAGIGFVVGVCLIVAVFNISVSTKRTADRLQEVVDLLRISRK